VIVLWTGRKDTDDGETIYGYDKPFDITDTLRSRKVWGLEFKKKKKLRTFVQQL